MRRFSSANARSGRSKIGSKIRSRIGSIGKIGKRRQRPSLHRDQERRSEATENSDKASKDSDIFENAADATSDNHQQLPSSSSSSSSSSSTTSGVSQVVPDGTGTVDTVAELVGLPPSAPITDSAGQGKVSSAEKMAPILADDVEVVTLAVSCGENEAELRLNDLRGGSRRSCVQFGGTWMTPNEFQSVSGRGNAKDWKRSIRHHGRPLKFLMERGLLSMTPPFCLCQVCESQGSENRCGVVAADVKPIKRTKISSTAKEDSQTIGRRRRKYTTAIDLNPEETQTRRKTRKKKQNEAIDRNIQHNQYGRRRRRGRRAGDSGKPKTPASTRRRRCTSKTASNVRTGNFEKLLKGTEKSGRLKRGDVEGERVEPHEKALELCDDDSRTIIDGGELFAAAVAAATAATDGESPSGSGAVDAAYQEIVAGREENAKGFEISVAEDGVALCETERPRKRGRKRKAAPMIQAAIDETKRADEKRAKIEDGSDEFFAEPESRKADDKKVPELNKSLREDDTELNGRSCLDKDEKRNAEIENAKSVDKKLNENHPDRNRAMKLWHKEISDDKPDERTTDTKSITGLYDSEEFRNPLNDQIDERKDRFSSFFLQSTPFASQNKHIDSKQSQNGRLFTPSRQSSGTSCTSSRGGRRSRRGTGRGSGGRACVTSKMADSTTLFDARNHATMTSSSEPIESASDDVSRFGRPGDVTLAGVKTRNKKMDRIRPGNDVTKTKSLSLSPVKFPEAAENRFNEFPAGNFPETLFRNSLSANVDDDVRFRAMTSSSLLPVCSLRYLRDLYSGLDLVPPPPNPPPGHNPLETGRQRRRSRGSRQRRNGVVSSTTFDVPMTSSYDPTMTSLYDPTMTSLYVQQTSSSSMTPFQQHDPYRPSPPGGFLFYAQGAPLGRRPQPMDFYYGRGVEGGASLAVGRGVTPPGGSTDARFVYDECGALDLTVPKIRYA